MTQPLLTARDVATQLRIHPRTVFLLAQHGEMECQRFGRSARFRQEHVDRYLERTYRPTVAQMFSQLLHKTPTAAPEGNGR